MTISDADDCLDAGSIAPVYNVLGGQLQGARDQRCADLVQGNRTDPVLPAAAQDHHHHIALLDAQAYKVVCRLVGQLLDIGKGEAAFLIVVIAPNQCQLVRLLLCPFIYDVKAEVEVLRNVDLEIFLKILIGIEVDPR